jgi:hypothetical protein
VASHDGIVGALIDTNGDEADVELEGYELGEDGTGASCHSKNGREPAPSHPLTERERRGSHKAAVTLYNLN